MLILSLNFQHVHSQAKDSETACWMLAYIKNIKRGRKT